MWDAFSGMDIAGPGVETCAAEITESFRGKCAPGMTSD